ncbi:DUF2970 domain-containing protein [Ferrimonas pelagia]|uniref:DUF2970 domain-containing protein n=1 Tax=Ferrimonas pelagia TaxID=1177826 RepID=A0ABP9FHI2_9GAMM
MIRIIGSILAALFGVQSEANRQHDFQQRSALPYLLTGLVALLLFVLSLVLVVRWVLAAV